MPRESGIRIVVALPPAGALQPLQLQSSLYLLGTTLAPEQLQSIDFYQFETHEYGTFSLPIHLDAETLVASRMLELRSNLWPAREYAITRDGREAIQSAMHDIPGPFLNHAQEVVRWITSFLWKVESH